MLARYLNAPLLLLLWQVAPIDLKQDAEGRFRVSFGGGRGEFAFRDDPGYPAGMDCAGLPTAAKLPSTEAYRYASRGASAELWATNNVRIHAAIGGITDPTGERQGTFGTAQAVYEEKKFGLGLGIASLGGLKRSLQPSASARFGPLDGVSLRADYRFPEAGMGLLGGPRIGLGLNQGRSRKTRIAMGLATTPVPDSARRVGGFFEMDVPLGFLKNKGGFSLSGFLSGQYHGNETKQIYALGLGGWFQP